MCVFLFDSMHVYAAARDVWLSSEFKLYTDHIAWTSPCSSSYLKPSAALCWKNDTGLCTPILNSRLAMINSSSLVSGMTEVKELLMRMECYCEIFFSFCVIPFSDHDLSMLSALQLYNISTLDKHSQMCLQVSMCVCELVYRHMDDVLAFGSYVNLLDRQ